MTDGVNRIRKFLIHTKKAIWEKGGEGGQDCGWPEKRTVGLILVPEINTIGSLKLPV